MPTAAKPLARVALIAVAGLALASCSGGGESTAPTGQASGGSAVSCEDFSVAVVDDDLRRSALYAIENEEVDTTAFPGLEISYLALPALFQATATGQYDLIEGSLIGVPQARGQGIDLKIVALSSGNKAPDDATGVVGIYVMDDSPIRSAADLAGKTVGVTSFGSTGTFYEQVILDENYGLNSALQGGDVRWTELDPAQLVIGLERGTVDAIVGYSYVSWLMGQDEDKYRQLTNTTAEWRELTGGNNVSAAFQALGTQIEERPECYTAFQAMLTESIDYARENVSDIAATVAETTGFPAEYVEFQWGDTYDYVGNLDEEWLDAGQALWDEAKRAGKFEETLDIRDEVVQ
ncbi:MAG TPA: ABC transporter substrate-binding protein [Microbacterium sp.]|uniref:ABC transporter substrate-binding protein n=1 Tax=Microbacterium sp. TaxID=51671 RepID=UPI002C7B8A6C|nr:ABC transporter substrate-binding protein [Microbacterium sp.]HWI30811.1 ABC transporter substrate-binding protein [Microbacterium sp.]